MQKMRRAISTLAQARTYLEQHRAARFQYGPPGRAWNTRMQALCDQLGNPERDIQVIHVAGTSGKGSTTALIAAGLRSQGFRVGHTVSPHLHDIRERIQWGGVPIGRSQFLATLTSVALAAETSQRLGNEHPTSFELITACAIKFFADQRAHYVVLETGLGGRFDATNIATMLPKLCVLTPISGDHIPTLGRNILDVARHKLGILRKGDQVCSAEQLPEVQALLDVHMRDLGISLVPRSCITQVLVLPWLRGTRFLRKNSVVSQTFELKLAGGHQADNAGLAIDALSAVAQRDGWVINDNNLRRTLGRVSIPGRAEWRLSDGVPVLLDGAHNQQKIEALVRSVLVGIPATRPEVLFAVKRRKSWREMLAHVAVLGGTVHLTEVPGGVPIDRLEKECVRQNIKVGIVGKQPRHVMAAVRQWKPRFILVTGSLALVAKIRTSTACFPEEDISSTIISYA